MSSSLTAPLAPGNPSNRLRPNWPLILPLLGNTAAWIAFGLWLAG